jgi:hypothetical protein
LTAAVAIDILDLAESGQADKVMRDMRVRSLWSPYYFATVVLGYKELVNYLHGEELEGFVQRLLEGKTKQWIEWPRGFFKTTTFTITCGIWFTLPYNEEDTRYALDELCLPEDEWFQRLSLHDQDCTQLFAFETQPNAVKKVTEVKWHFEENEIFRSLFPEIAYRGEERPWTNDCIKIRRVGYGARSEEGTFEAIGVGGALQSRHYKVVWEDDLVGKKATESDTEMAKTIRWHGLLAGAFTDAARQWRFGVSNRWGFFDLNNHVRENEPDFVFHTISAWDIGSRGEEVPTFPLDGLGKVRYTMPALIRIRDSGSMTRYDFACQYMNRPMLPGEKEIGLTKLHLYAVETDGTMICSCGAKFKPSQLNRYLHYDPYNAKGVRSGSRPALATVGTSIDQHIFLLHYYIGKGDYARIFDEIFHMNDTWRPLLFTYEDVGHQNMCEFHIREVGKTDAYKKAHKRFPRIVAAPTQGKTKVIRIRENLIPLIEHGKFSRRANQTMFDEMLETFPHTVPGHDYDLLDALAQGAKHWHFPLSEDAIFKDKEEEDAYLQQLGKPYSQMEVTTR